ncbi:GntR family transcriptional regulator [Streptomyces sp. NPDC091412]|uniref:GntR family transcriptional regulator n=1 Tax=Streptomyces sp. NPDC091412 TaxID=3366002 RepID=UPI0037F30FFE
MDPDPGESLLRPVRSHHAFESCVERLATAIRLGGHPRGSALPTERILAERPGVSRATLREAISACADGGFRRDAPGSRRWHRRRPPAAEARGGVAVVLARRTSGRLGVPADRRAGAAHPAAKAADPDARRHAQVEETPALVDEAADPAGHRQAVGDHREVTAALLRGLLRSDDARRLS